MMKTVEKSTSKPCNNPFLGLVAFAKSIDSKVNNGLSISYYLSSIFVYPYKYLATFYQPLTTLSGLKVLPQQEKHDSLLNFGYPRQHLATPTTLKRTLLTQAQIKTLIKHCVDVSVAMSIRRILKI
jgi:hypothetical protein